MAKTKTSQLDLIRSLLKDSFQDRSSSLAEKGVSAKGISFDMKRSILSHRDLDYILYRFDPNKRDFFPYFAEIEGLRKICDYVMFVEEGKSLNILLIELKLGTESATKQLEASTCFIEFIMQSGKRLKLGLSEDYNIYKIRISEERSKRRNRGTKLKALQRDQNEIINYDHSHCFRIKEVLGVLT